MLPTPTDRVGVVSRKIPLASITCIAENYDGSDENDGNDDGISVSLKYWKFHVTSVNDLSITAGLKGLIH